jgi:hypothetical protein
METPTPRTDEYLKSMGSHAYCNLSGCEHIDTEFARNLEREIAAMREVNEHNRKAYAELEVCEKNALAELSISNDERDHYRRENAAMREAIQVAYKGLLTADDDGDYSDHGPNDVTKAIAKLKPFIKP